MRNLCLVILDISTPFLVAYNIRKFLENSFYHLKITPIYIHHINPISKEDIINSSDKLFDPENLVCVSMDVHNALHYGDSSILEKNKVVERIPNDTCPWKK